MRGDAPAPPSIRSLGATVYLPTLLFGLGQGAVAPVIALTALELGASPASAGLVVALQGVGRMLFNIPAGRLIDGLGERRAMTVGTVILLASLAGAIASPGPVPFAASVFVMGWGWSVWLLARLTYVSDVMPFRLRGRALSTLGGFNRIGSFGGPFVGAAAIASFGLGGAYWSHIALAVAGLVAILAVPDPPGALIAATAVGGARASTAGLAKAHARVFLTAGFGAATLSLLRASRHAVVPLWGAHVGLDAAQVSVVFGLSAGLDMVLFYPAGAASDRWGRKAVAVPCISLLSAGFVLLPFTDSLTTVTAAALLMGLGNGLGSGIVMTLGADFAPPAARASFLGLWRTVSDLGAAAGPLAFGVAVAAASLSVGSVSMGLIGLVGAAVVAVALPSAPDGEGTPPGADPAASPSDPT